MLYFGYGGGSGAAALLYLCFGQHALMHALARPLHDGAEVRAVRSRAVQLIGKLATSDEPTVQAAMRRAGVWSALVSLVLPVKVAGEAKLIDLGARPIFERVAAEGTPEALAFFEARPGLRQRLAELKLPMPPAPSLAALGTRARATLLAEGDHAGLPPPPAPGGSELPPRPPPVAQGDVPPAVSSSALMARAARKPQDAPLAAVRHHAASTRRELEYELAAELATEGPADAASELRLLRHAGTLVRQPWSHHGGDASSQRAYLHAILTLAVRRADRSMRTLVAAAQRDEERAVLGLPPPSARLLRSDGGASPSPRASSTAPATPWVPASFASNPLESASLANARRTPMPGARAALSSSSSAFVAGSATASPRAFEASASAAAQAAASAARFPPSESEVRSASARATAEAAASAAAEASAEACVTACLRLFDATWRVAAASIDAVDLMLGAGATQWVARTALQTSSGAPSARLADGPDEAVVLSMGSPATIPPLPSSALVSGAPHSAPRVLSEPSQVAPLRLGRMAAVLLMRHVLLRATKRPGTVALVSRVRLGLLAIDSLQRQQHELSAALAMESAVPRVYLQQYAAGRQARLALWAALLRAGGLISEQLEEGAAVDRLILTGALPFALPFSLPLLKLPASFVPYHKSMALRHEGLVMLAALVDQRAARPRLFDQLLTHLQRDRCLLREAARLAPLVGGPLPRTDREEQLCASAVTLFLILDSASDLRLWQLIGEADAAQLIHQVHKRMPDIPPAPLSRLLDGEHTLQKPLGRAAATFVGAMRDYEHTHQESHPLMTGAIRGGV